MKPEARYRELRRWYKLAGGFYRAVQQQRGKDTDTYKTLDRVVEEVSAETGADRFNLIGHSFGGILALDYALDRPERVGEILTIASAYAGTRGIHWSQTMRMFGVYDPVLYEMLHPKGTFIKRLHAKMGKMYAFAEHGVKMVNLVSGQDEFVRPDEMRLEKMIGRRPYLTELRVEEGHCESLFHPEVERQLKQMMANKRPTIGLHPIIYSQEIFDELKSQLDDEQRKRFYTFDYDYLKLPEQR